MNPVTRSLAIYMGSCVRLTELMTECYRGGGRPRGGPCVRARRGEAREKMTGFASERRQVVGRSRETGNGGQWDALSG